MASVLNVAVVGATGAVGREVVRILGERNFPLNELHLLASNRSAGQTMEYNGTSLVVRETDPEIFRYVDVAFFAAGGSVSRSLAPQAVRAGALVVDKSSVWRMDENVPLVIPEINVDDVEKHRGIISSPNCSTIVMLMPLGPLHKSNPIIRIIVDTYQSASGAGGKGVTELLEQTKDVMSGNDMRWSTFPHPLAFNVIPHVESFRPDGYTTEEHKLRDETRKIMHEPDMVVSATCVRVPVTVSHSEAVHVDLTDPMTPEECRDLLRHSPGVIVQDYTDDNEYPMARDVAGRDEVFVGRIREDPVFQNGLSLWVVGDNLRKGAALNAIQIAEAVIERDCLKPHSDDVRP